jgi:predicted  nucleic acid-binding Zn-ribbon protein
MKEQVQQLLELQELEFISKESAIVHSDGDADEDLETRICKKRRKIPADLLARYDRLTQFGPSIVAVKGGMCVGCNLSIPQGDLNRIINGSVEPVCPHCNRFLNIDVS